MRGVNLHTFFVAARYGLCEPAAVSAIDAVVEAAPTIADGVGSIGRSIAKRA